MIGVSHTAWRNIHILITSTQEVDNMTLHIVGGKYFLKVQMRFKNLHYRGYRDILTSCILCKIWAKLTIFSPHSMWTQRKIYIGIRTILFTTLNMEGKGNIVEIGTHWTSEGTDERNGIDQVKSGKRWHSILLFKYNIKLSYIFRIVFIMNEHDLIQLKIISGV